LHAAGHPVNLLHGDAHRSEQAGIDAAKKYLRVLGHALPRALRRTKTGLTAADFAMGTTLARSTPRISEHLTKIRPHVATLDSELTAAFGGKAHSRNWIGSRVNSTQPTPSKK
jgi:hypothetical protein